MPLILGPPSPFYDAGPEDDGDQDHEDRKRDDEGDDEKCHAISFRRFQIRR